MSAQPAQPARPAPSPLDPAAILEALPDDARSDFLALYRQALAAAADPAGFAALLKMLRLWSMRAPVMHEPWYAEARAQASGPLEGGMFLDDYLRQRDGIVRRGDCDD